MKRKGFLWLGFAVLAMFAVALQAGAVETPAAGKVDAKAAFERLKSLAGNWQGGTGVQGVPATVTYRVGSNGSIVTETLFPNTEHEMMTVYFLQGSDLVATHYCAMGNQPHFKLDAAKSTPTELVFAFDGGTGFDAAKDGHIHDGVVRISDDGKVDASWTFYVGGERKGANEIHLTRAAK